MGKKRLTKAEIEKRYGNDSKKMRKKLMLEENEPEGEQERQTWRNMIRQKRKDRKRGKK